MSTVAAELQARIEAPDSSPPNHVDPGLPVEEVESIELRPIHRATEKHEALCYIERLNPASRAAQSSAVLDPSPVSIPSTEHRDVERGPPSLADHSDSNDLDTVTSTIIGKCLYVLEFIIWLPYYTLFLLCMPHLYKARVDSIIESGIDISSGVPDDAGLASFEKRWVRFVSSLSYEWKTMYLFSGVVIAAIPGLFQVGGFLDESTTTTIGVITIITAVIGVIVSYIYRRSLSETKKSDAGVIWVQGASAMQSSIYFKPSMLLAAPSVFTAWTMILFLMFLVSYVWRLPLATNGHDPLGQLASSAASESAAASMQSAASDASSTSTLPMGSQITIGVTSLMGVAYAYTSISYFLSLGAARGAD